MRSQFVTTSIIKNLFALSPSTLGGGQGVQLIQLIPASGFHFVVLFFNFVQNSIELFPVISPTPNLLSFHPPNEKGSLGTGTPTFTPIIPALAFSITYLAKPPFCVN